MKKSLLFVALISTTSAAVYCAQHTITNSGFTFTPDYIEINPGDTVIFSLGQIHDAVEVSEETWNANENTRNGGFVVPFGGGQITLSTIGIHYYVCEPHASLGMKGRINVIGPSEISSVTNPVEKVRIYPNPATDNITLEYTLTNPGLVSIKVNDITGREIVTLLQEDQSEGFHRLTHSIGKQLNPGLYFIEISEGDQSTVQKVIIE